MTKFLLSVHVLAAILAIGPIAVAASLFPRCVRASAGPPSGSPGAANGLNADTAVFLHRVCRVYTVVGIAVPVFGLATGAQLGVLGDAWLLASVVLTAGAAALLVLGILPGQRRLLLPAAGTADATGPRPEEPRTASRTDSRAASRLGAITGVFNLLWAIVVVLMIVRPGSTTGA